jgi:hypothetical protein
MKRRICECKKYTKKDFKKYTGVCICQHCKGIKPIKE